MTAPTTIRVKIDAATEAIDDASNDLRQVVAATAGAPRADKVEAGAAVRTASLKLKAAIALLRELEGSLALEKQRTALAKLAAARTALTEAEHYLDKTLAEAAVVSGADTTWVTKVVKDAFIFLEVAKANLVDAEAAAADDD